MSISKKVEFMNPTDSVILTELDKRFAWQDSRIELLLQNINGEIKMLDKKLTQIDQRLWQIIILLLSYPLGLIIGKLCHVF